ncbi:nicotinate-nicotinamide nucleotide adenylyltransferase [Vibrio paucivorans]
MSKIAVFGSAFNPPSLGHKSVIESLSHFDKVLLIPSIAHAWGKHMLDYSLRCQLVDVFIEDIAQPNVERSIVEEQLVEPGQSVTTYAVLSHLASQHPEAELTFVMGPDNLFNFAKFYKAEEILQRWNVLACPEKVQIRSTDIRKKLADGSNIGQMTTPKVAALLKELSLY